MLKDSAAALRNLAAGCGGPGAAARRRRSRAGAATLGLPCNNSVETGGHYVWRWWYRWLLTTPRPVSQSVDVPAAAEAARLLLARRLWQSQLVTSARRRLLRLQPRSNSPKLQQNLGLARKSWLNQPRSLRPVWLIGQQRLELRRLLLTRFPWRPLPVASPRLRCLRLQPRRSSRKYQRNLRHVRKSRLNRPRCS